MDWGMGRMDHRVTTVVLNVDRNVDGGGRWGGRDGGVDGGIEGGGALATMEPRWRSEDGRT